jgi:uncharacterized protein YlxP (DUF503 family)
MYGTAEAVPLTKQDFVRASLNCLALGSAKICLFKTQPASTSNNLFREDADMPIGTLTLELGIEHAQSLKDRRQAVRSLKDKLRHGFNISVAELDDALAWNRATLGVAAISGSASYLRGQLREVEAAARRIANGLGCEILDSFIESDVVLDAE